MSNPATNIDKWPALHPGHCIPGGTYSTPNGKEDRCTTEPVWTLEKRKISCSCYKWTPNTLVMQIATYQLHNWAVPEQMGQNEKPTSENLLISKKGVLTQIMNDKCPITSIIKHTIFIRYRDINVSFYMRDVSCFYMQNSLAHICVHFLGNKAAWTSKLMKMLKQHYRFTDAQTQMLSILTQPHKFPVTLKLWTIFFNKCLKIYQSCPCS